MSERPSGFALWGATWSRRGDLLGLSPLAASKPAPPLLTEDDEDEQEQDKKAAPPTEEKGAPPRKDDAEEDDDDPESSQALATGPVVAVVQIRDVLASEVSEWECGFQDGYHGKGGIVDRVQAALADPNVSALVLDLDSPGGDAAGVGEAASQIARLRGMTSKPVLVYARTACSAAFWLATAAAGEGGLYVSESSDVGNVGCYAVHVDASGQLADDGLKVSYIADPPGKVLGNPAEPLADGARARLQRGVSDTTARFCAAVANFRPNSLTTQDLMALDGDVRRGGEAISAGLADGMASGLSDVVALAYSRAMAASRPPVLGAAPSPPASSSGDHMSAALIRSLYAAAKLDVSGAPNDALAEAALAPRLAFAADVLALLGENDPARAKGKLTARLESAAQADELRAQLGQTAAELDTKKRRKLVEDAVADGRLRAGQAWDRSEGANGQRTLTIKGWLSKMSTSEMEGYLTSLPALHQGANRDEAPDVKEAEQASALRGVPANLKALASRHKIDPAALAVATQALFGRRAEEN